MCDLKKLQEILNPSVKITELSLSFVNRLFPEFNDAPCIILYREKTSPESPEHDRREDSIDEDQTSVLEVTGSPLKYSFNDVDLDDTVMLMNQNWQKDEERYWPLDRTVACSALNLCIPHVRNNKNCAPLFALCDGQDARNSRLIGAVLSEEGWFTTIEVYSTDRETVDLIKNPSPFFQEHLKLSAAQERDVAISAFNVFHRFGVREEMIDWKTNLRKNYEGGFSIEVDTSSLSLYPAARTSKNNFVIQIALGSSNNSLKELWDQLLLLNRYLTLIEEYKKDKSSEINVLPFKFPKEFTFPYREEDEQIMENLNLLLNGNYSYRNSNSMDPQKSYSFNDENADDDITIEKHIKNLPFRNNFDFTDFLWELLIKNTNYSQMTKCLHAVFKEIFSNGCHALVIGTNATRFAKIIGDPYSQKVISHLLQGSLPLEYVVDVGLEKLSRDYMDVLTNTRFGQLYEIRQKFGNVSSGEFQVDSYRKKLICMAQIHACLEFMLLAQNELACSTSDLKPLFSCAFKKFVSDESPVRNHEDLDKNEIYTLTTPVPVSMMSALPEENPSTRRISLSSQSKFSRFTSTRYYSRQPIFPTNIYAIDEQSTTEETYDVTNAITTSHKFR